MMPVMEDQQDGMGTNVEYDLIYAVKNDNESEVTRLINAGADVNQAEGEPGKTALFYAVQQKNNQSVVRALIDAGAHVNTTDNEGKTALFYAVLQSDNERVVRALIDAKPDVNTTDNEGQTALFYAVQQSSNENVVLALIDAGTDVKRTDYGGKTALFYAVQQSNNESVVLALIGAKADVNTMDIMGKTALFYAVQQSDNEIVVRTLIAAKADVNKTDYGGKTALFYAVQQSNNESVVRALIDAGIDVRGTDNEGKTALSYAVQQSNNESVVRTLIDAKADVNTIDMMGKTALFSAVQQSNNESVVRALIDAKADVNTTNNEGKTALFYAVQQSSEIVVSALIDAKADVNRTDNEGKTALFYAVQQSSEIVVRALIDAGIDVRGTDNEGKTALFYAVQQKNNQSVVRALSHAGIDVNRTDKEGKTALFYAVQQSTNESLVRALIDAGADVSEIDKHGKTALFYANKNNNVSMVCELIDCLVLIGSTFSINEIDAKGVLLNAVRNGKTEVVRKLIHAGVAVDEVDGEGKKALFEAVCCSNETIVHLLVEEGKALVIAKDDYGRTPLFYAITKSTKIASYLFERAIVNDSDLCSILQFFLENRNKESDTSHPPIDKVLKLLQDNGLKPKRIAKAIVNIVLCKIPLLLTSVTKSHRSENSLASIRIHWTRKMESLLNVLKEVSKYVETTTDVNKERVIRMLELIEDPREDHISDVFSLLKEFGANPNCADVDGNTAFHNVMHLPFLGVPKETVMDLCERLLSFGVPLTKGNHHGETPLLFCLSRSLENLEEEDKSPAMKTLVQVCTFLVNHGSNIEKTKSGESVFHFIIKLFQEGLQIRDETARKNVIDEALKLLELFSSRVVEGNFVNKSDDCGLNSPLHLWATLAFTASRSVQDYTTNLFGEYTFEKLLEKIQTHLVRCGALKNLKNKNGETPLHLCNTWSAVKLLIKIKANPNDKDSSNRPPLLVAAMRKTFLVYPSHFYPDVQEDAKSFFKTAVSEMKLDPWTADKKHKSVLGILIEFDTDNLSEALVDVACDGTLSIEEREFKKIFISLLIAISRDQSLHTFGKVDLARTLLSSAKKRKIHVADEPLKVWCETMKSKRLNDEEPCKKRSREEQESVQISIAKLLRENGANLTGVKLYEELKKIYPEIHTIMEEVEVQEMIPRNHVSNTHKAVLDKVARRQECKEVNSICFWESPVKSGSFGELFVGINKSDSEEVAIERLNESTTQQAQEMKIRIAKLHCEQVVRYYSNFKVDDSFYIVFELMEGNLDDYLSDNCPAFDSSKSTLLCKDVVEGLAYLHQQNIVHGNLNPTNVFFKTHPKLCLKITYFDQSLSADSTSTHSWMSPELLKPGTKKHSKASDTFSCGLLLHYILSRGQRPFSPADKSRYDSLSPKATHLLIKMLESDESNRPSAVEVMNHLFFWSEEEEIQLLTAVGNQPEFECPRRKRSVPLTPVEIDLENSFSAIVRYGSWKDPRYSHMPDVYKEVTRSTKKVKVRSYYDTSSAVELVRFIRNAYAHVSSKKTPAPIIPMNKLLLEDFVFLKYFPALVMEVYKAVTTHGWDQTRDEIKRATRK